MTAVHANTDAFDGFSWHDNQVHGLRWELGDPERGEWHHRLVLDIDHIVEWTGAGIGEGRFRVAPASLVFEDVQDLKLSVDWGESGSLRMVNFNHPTIDNIERIPIPDAPPPFQGRYWRWSIHFNAPEGGLIAFIAIRLPPDAQDRAGRDRRAVVSDRPAAAAALLGPSLSDRAGRLRWPPAPYRAARPRARSR